MQAILDDAVRFTAGMTRATRAFAKSKPWRGTVAERAAKFADYHAAVAAENELTTELVVLEQTITDRSGASGSSGLVYMNENGEPTRQETERRAIVMAGRLSVVTYLFLVGLALGYKRTEAMKFAVNLFRQRFPRSFAACRFEGGLLVR